jgi:hypothetical protein
MPPDRHPVCASRRMWGSAPRSTALPPARTRRPCPSEAKRIAQVRLAEVVRREPRPPAISNGAVRRDVRPRSAEVEWVICGTGKSGGVLVACDRPRGPPRSNAQYHNAQTITVVMYTAAPMPIVP